MKFGFMAHYQQDYPITLMCRVLEVSVSGYYAWRQREPSRRAMQDQALGEQIEHIFSANRGVYGSPRIHVELRDQGQRCGRPTQETASENDRQSPQEPGGS